MKILALLIRIAFGFIEFVLAIRFILKLIGANASSSFVDWFYQNSNGLVAPFKDIITPLTFGNGFSLEFSTIIAMVIYAIAGYILGELIEYIGKTLEK